MIRRCKETKKQRVKKRTRSHFVSYFLSFCLLVSLLLSLFISSAVASRWKELKGDHFIIYHQGEDSFAQEVLRRSELYYQQVSSDLGYARYSNFWQWENRVKIYIYPTREEFLRATGEREWSHGMANYATKEIFSYAWRERFLDSFLPHEITHLIFRDYVGFKGEIPLWLDEGVAQWQEPEKRAVVKEVMRSVLEKGETFSLGELTRLDIRQVADTEQTSRFYIQAASLIDFLIQEYGAEGFITFCRQLRDGKNLEEALRFAFPTSIRNLNELEEQWKKFVLSA